jgi:hypothetical protein
MNCQEVQGQLSDYADLSLSSAQLVLVQEHLAACPPCREEAELLEETIREVASLPLLDTPLGFAQRVMSHVREMESKPSFWQRLLLPLSGKIPAPAIALVVVGFLGIYLLQKEEPQLTSVQTTNAGAVRDESAQSPAATFSSPEITPIRPTETPLAKYETPSASFNQRIRPDLPKESKSRVETSSIPPADGAPAISLPASPSNEPALRTTPIVSGSPVSSPSPSRSGNGSSFSPAMEPDAVALRAAPAAIEPFADLELVLRRHITSPAEIRGDVAGTWNAEARQASIERPASPRPIDRLMAAIPDRTRPQTIWINVPENQYEEFKRELHALGMIESEARVPLLRDQGVSHSDGQIRVKLTALPAGETATPNSAGGR